MICSTINSEKCCATHFLHCGSPGYVEAGQMMPPPLREHASSARNVLGERPIVHRYSLERPAEPVPINPDDLTPEILADDGIHGLTDGLFTAKA